MPSQQTSESPQEGSHASPASADERVQSIADLCQTGQRAMAELEIHAWIREGDAPAAVRRLLGALLALRGETAEAQRVLAAITGDTTDDAVSLMLLATLRALAGQSGPTAKICDRLAGGFPDEAGPWLEAVGLESDVVADPAISMLVVEHLAAELRQHVDITSSLVASLKAQPDRHDILHLRAAVEMVLPGILLRREQMILHQAMTELSMLAEDPAAVRRWAEAGLELDPYHAVFALAMASLDDDQATSMPAIRVLANAAAAHPTWPDLQIALIRREHAHGDAQSARMRLSNWLSREPGNPHALDLEKELAA